MTLLIALITLFAFALQDAPAGSLNFKVLDLVYTVKNLEATVLNVDVKETDTEVRVELAAGALFESDRATLLPAAERTLAEVAQVVGGRGRGDIRVEGHTDSHGSDAHNQKLSRQRADSVASWLRKQPDLIARTVTAEGFAGTRPVASNTKPGGDDDAEGRQNNSRVEIIVRK